MTENNGRQTNKEVFWDSLSSTCGKDVQKDSFIFDGFYESSFYKVRESCGFAPEAAEVVGKFKQSGFRLALATNPLFPAVATENRIRWAGLEPDDFELFTSYEESHYCKPNLDYYREVLTALNVFPEECMMVGNDVSEDMIAEQLGMKVFLLTDCIINRNNLDISGYPHGSFKELAEYVENLTGKVH